MKFDGWHALDKVHTLGDEHPARPPDGDFLFPAPARGIPLAGRTNDSAASFPSTRSRRVAEAPTGGGVAVGPLAACGSRALVGEHAVGGLWGELARRRGGNWVTLSRRYEESFRHVVERTPARAELPAMKGVDLIPCPFRAHRPLVRNWGAARALSLPS